MKAKKDRGRVPRFLFARRSLSKTKFWAGTQKTSFLSFLSASDFWQKIRSEMEYAFILIIEGLLSINDF